tara:strand:- start:1512 stop:2720 length:1209 start_codon:yes stop_codon:yes gene_type:complete
MAITSSGSIGIMDIVNEFGGTAPHSLSEYYRNGGEVPGNNTNVPTSGTISLSNFYSAVNEIQQVYSSSATNLNLSSIFGSNWSTAVPKRVVINSGVTIGGTGSNYAINVPSGMGGTLIIDNNGNIQGHGGTINGGTGGTAVYCSQTSGVTINNNSGASIKAGGGGGGKGGTGGTGGNGGNGGTGGQGKTGQHLGQVYEDGTCAQSHSNRQLYCRYRFGWNAVGGYNTCAFGGYGYFGAYMILQCYKWIYHNGGSGGAGGSSGGAGGAGGNGGVGQGYNQAAASGATGYTGQNGSGGSGGQSVGNNAGNGGSGGARGRGGQGGTGGAGGSFGNNGANGSTGATGQSGSSGQSGANGNHTNGSGGSGGSSGSGGSGGQSGGSAGTYIYNRNSITFNNSGSVAGN